VASEKTSSKKAKRRIPKPKLRELVEAIKAVVKGPYTTKFPAAPSEPYEAFRGKPEYDEAECIGCVACAEVCPSKAIHVTDDLEASPPMRKLELHYDECIFCGQCELNCTTEKGIHLTQEYDLGTLDRTQCRESIEKELVVCEMCGELVGAKDHILWVARKVGTKSYANPTLLLVRDESEKLVAKPSPRPEGPASRSDLFSVLCPRCRRAVLVRENWSL